MVLRLAGFNRIKELLRIERGRTKVAPSYDEVHALLALILMQERGIIGRKSLALSLGLGETSTRNLISLLEKRGLIERRGRGGRVLTDLGREIVEEFRRRVRRFEPLRRIPEELMIDRFAYLALTNWKFLSLRSRTEIRDMLVRKGASGALVVEFRERKAIIPFDDKRFVESVELWRALGEPECCEDDVALVSFSGSQLGARYSLASALLDLLL